MTAPNVEPAPIIKGWCPSAWRPMRSGDGFLMRARPHCGRLTPQQMLGLADLCENYANGAIELSVRGNAQLRGVREDHLEVLREKLLALELIAPQRAQGPAILIEPFWREGEDSVALERLFGETIQKFQNMPDKFGIAIDAGALPVLREAPADIRLERDEGGALICRPDGSKTGAPVTLETASAVLADLMGWFLETGGVVNGRGRMKTHLLSRPLPEVFRRTPLAPTPGERANPGPTRGGILVAFAFGQATAAQLRAMAAWGPARLTPWRMMFIENFTGDRSELTKIPDMILDPANPLLRVVACVGKPFCPQAFSPTREIARRLAPFVPSKRLLHVSGCAKGCAHPAPASMALTARGEAFDAIPRGRADDAPFRSGLKLDEFLARPDQITEVFNAMGF